MKRLLLAVAVAVACGCSQEPRTATNTIAPAEPRPAPTPRSALPDRPAVTTSGSPPPASGVAPGTALVTLGEHGIEMRKLLPRAHTAFQIDNRTADAHELTLRGPAGAVVATLPAHGSAVMQMLLGAGTYELVCTVPGHAERAAFETYVAGAPLDLPDGAGAP